MIYPKIIIFFVIAVGQCNKMTLLHSDNYIMKVDFNWKVELCCISDRVKLLQYVKTWFDIFSEVS